MTYFTATRSLVTRAKTWGAGEVVDLSRLTPSEIEDAYESGAIVSSDVLPSPPAEGVTDHLDGGVLYIAHRGGALLYPGNTLEAYRAAVAAGATVIEQDCHVLADGSIGVMHDATVDATTTSTGYVADHTASSWKALTIDTGATLGGVWTSLTQNPPLFDEVIREFGNKVVLAPEAKSTGTGEPLVKALQDGGIRHDAALVQSASLTELAPAIAAGYPTLYLSDSADPAAVAAAGVTWVGVQKTVSEAYVQSLVAAGLKVAVWTVDERYIRDKYIGYGASGFFSDDPQYLSDGIARTSDAFSCGAWIAGCNATTGTNRGEFTAPNQWGIDKSTGGALWVRHGALYIPESGTFTMDLELTIDAGTDITRWVAFWVGETDYPWSDQGATSTNPYLQGYHLLVKRNDYMAIWRYDGSSGFKGNLTGDVLQGVGITDGVPFQIRIAVTPASVTITQLSGGNPTGAGCTTTDTNHRGRYIAIGTSGTKFRINDLSIS